MLLIHNNVKHLAMKKIYLFVLASILILFVSCSDESVSREQLKLSVKEYKTGMTLPDVNINLYYCYYDVEFGCQKRLLMTYKTNSSGECSIPETDYEKADMGIRLEKPQYWSRAAVDGDNYLEPEAWARIMVKTNTVNTSTNYLILNTTGELGVTSTLSSEISTNSVVDFRLFGNELNNVSWSVYQGGYPPYCSTCSLIASGNLVLNPKKFEVVTSSIDY